MKFNCACYTAKGMRANNEDSVSLLELNESTLAMVADGLGGHADGEIASKQAVTTIEQSVRSSSPSEDSLIDAIVQANTTIRTIQDPQHPMHTTIAALWLENFSGIAAHVGDSRIYQFRDNMLVFQSIDHSVAQMAVLVGELDPRNLRYSKDRNRLIRVLGGTDRLKVDTQILSVQPGDRFLLCSDGFWEGVTEAEMLKTISSSSTAESWLTAMRSIVENAANPSQDNYSAIAIIVCND